jgi:hypothetical protein
LIGLYLVLQDTLGLLATFLLQAALVFVVLAGATWFRYGRRRTGWLFFGDDTEATGEPSTEDETDAESEEYRKAS